MQSIEFYAALTKAVREGLAQVLGSETARAVDFYIDPSIAVRDIGKYTNMLEKVFGEGSKILETKIAERLFANLNLTFVKKDGYRLPNYVEEAKSRSS